MSYQETFDKSAELRDAFWNDIGQSDPHVIAPMVNPSFMGGPRWPSLRQAYRVVHLPNGTILASDGLSDPFDDMETNPNNANYQGYGLEFYIKTYDDLNPSDTGSWQIQLLVNMCQYAAHDKNLADLFGERKMLSMSLANPGLPERFVHPENYVGALLGMIDAEVPATIDLPLKKSHIINIKLLTLAELNYCMEHKDAGRQHVAALLSQQPEGAYSTLERASVI